MKKSIKIIAGFIALGMVFCGLYAVKNLPTYNHTLLPNDALPSCTISKDSFAKWFARGKITENGLVVPANSVNFPHRNNCDFYQWAEQMFLWITSTSSGRSVLESQLFYDVSPEDSTFQRYLTPHNSSRPLNMSSHLVKNGPNKLPVIRDQFGRLFEVESFKSTPNAKDIVQDANGKTVRVARIKTGIGGVHNFYDSLGKQIQNPKAIIIHPLNRQQIIHEFVVGGERVYLNAAGNEIQAEEGQATSDVLMAQHGSLVYYLILVNDVYAYFLTANKNGKMNSINFPTTATARDSICSFAKAAKHVLPDSNALAIELKTSWVETKNLPDSDSYIRVNAVIPTYNTSNPKQWIPDGYKTARMALIGIHIVGSVAGHPEMIWATFEHRSNSPDTTYSYIDINHKIKTVKQEKGRGWLLSNNTTDTGYNVSNMKSTSISSPNNNYATLRYSDTIYADSGKTIKASNTLRQLPWGSAMDSATNPEDKSAEASNSKIISINNIITEMLVGNDIRKNYLFIGATWTQGGAPPNGSSYSFSDSVPGVAIGTSAPSA